MWQLVHVPPSSQVQGCRMTPQSSTPSCASWPPSLGTHWRPACLACSGRLGRLQASFRQPQDSPQPSQGLSPQPQGKVLPGMPHPSHLQGKVLPGMPFPSHLQGLKGPPPPQMQPSAQHFPLPSRERLLSLAMERAPSHPALLPLLLALPPYLALPSSILRPSATQRSQRRKAVLSYTSCLRPTPASPGLTPSHSPQPLSHRPSPSLRLRSLRGGHRG